MMNAIAISLVFVSLATASVWSPPPPESHDDIIVKEGHRVVVIEYDQDGNSNTKVSISPDHDLFHHQTAEDVSDHAEESDHDGPKELICDAFGKCRHKIASAYGRAKEEAVEEVHEVEEAAREAKGAAEEKMGKMKEEVLQKTDEARDGVRNKVESVKDVARSVKEGVSESAGERVREKARDVKAGAESVRSWVKRMKDFGERHLRKHLGLDAILGLLSLVGFVTAYGMCVWVTFVSSYVLASVLPRHQFGMVQSKIYPVYFRVMVYSISATLLGHLLGRRKLLITSQPDALQAYNLLTAILSVLVNMLYLEPRATKVMMEKMKQEKEEGRGRDLIPETGQGTGIRRTDGVPPAAETTPATEGEDRGEEAWRSKVRRLRKLNSYSSRLNVMSLMSLTWHLVYLSQRLSMTC